MCDVSVFSGSKHNIIVPPLTGTVSVNRVYGGTISI